MRFSYDPSTGATHVDGVDITSTVRRVTIDHHAHNQPEVYLELAQGCVTPDVLEGDAVVHLVREGVVDRAAVIREWLDVIDPAMLEQMLLLNTTLDTPQGVGILDNLKKLAADLG